MKSRMDKYYNDDEYMQRTTKNDSLYNELYKEKQKLSNNVTVLDNMNEIDLTKIKEMMDNREDYKKVKGYNALVSDSEDDTQLDYHFDEIDNNAFDINKILEQKKKSYEEDIVRIRSITKEEYDDLKSLDIDRESLNKDFVPKEELKDLLNTITSAEDDLFSNLKDEKKEFKEETKEEVFYTNTSKIAKEDFEDFNDAKSGMSVFTIIAIIGVVIAVGVFVYLKFFQ